MAYATAQDIIDAIGEDDLLLISDRDGNMLIDQTVVDSALEDASGEIDGYVSVKYSVPLVTVSQLITRFCVDIAVYLMCNETTISDLRINRYNNAIKTLRLIAKGEIAIGIPTTDPDSNGGVTFSTRPRQFGRGNLL